MHIRFQKLILYVFGAVLALFLLVPLLALALTLSPESLWLGLQHPLVVPALRLSLLTSLTSLGVSVLLGTPLAWILARAHHPLARGLETVFQLPVVMPPAVAGVSLLLAFGKKGLFTTLVGSRDGGLSFSVTAVVLAQLFVSAPLFLQAAISAFRRVDSTLVLVARSFGARPLRVFWRVAVPLALPGIAAGAALGWARALGEFGATLMFAGNLEGYTQTLPLAVYTALEADLRVAQALSLVLVVLALVLLVLAKLALRRALSDAGAHT